MSNWVALRGTRCCPGVKPKAHSLGRYTLPPRRRVDDQHLPRNGTSNAVPSLTPTAPTAFLRTIHVEERGVSGQARTVQVHRALGTPGATLAPCRSTSSGLIRHLLPVSFTIESILSRPGPRLPEVRNASTEGPAPDTTAGTPAARSRPICADIPTDVTVGRRIMPSPRSLNPQDRWEGALRPAPRAALPPAGKLSSSAGA